MSSFTCKCGTVTREDEGPPSASGVLLSISVLASLEEQIARSIVEFLSLSEAQRGSWLQSHFWSQYPKDLSADEVAHDIISRAFNSAVFSSTFLCPNCGRLALAVGPDRGSWSFFTPE